MFACPREDLRIPGCVRFGSRCLGAFGCGKSHTHTRHQRSNLPVRPRQTRSISSSLWQTYTGRPPSLSCQIVSNPKDTSATTPAAAKGWCLVFRTLPPISRMLIFCISDEYIYSGVYICAAGAVMRRTNPLSRFFALP